jgi:hypothetical protein
MTATGPYFALMSVQDLLIALEKVKPNALEVRDN